MGKRDESPPDQAELQQYFDCIFRPDDLVEIRFLGNGKSTSEWHPANALPSIVSRLLRLNREGWNIHVGANPRISTGCGVKAKDCTPDQPCGRCAKCVKLARTLFVDCDDCSVDEARRLIDKAGLPAPTILINSGHGVHAYWLLTEPITDLKLWTRYQKGLIRRLKSDSVVHDPPRVMRLPGFLNVKDEPHVPCAIVECEPARAYGLDEFEPEPEHRRARGAGTTSPNGVVGEAVRRFLRDGAKVGDRNKLLFSAACDLAGRGYSIDSPEVHSLRAKSIELGLDEQEIDETIRSAFGNPREPGNDERLTLESIAPLQVAEAYLTARQTNAVGENLLVRYRKAWWRFDGSRYVELEHEEARVDPYLFLDRCDFKKSGKLVPYSPGPSNVTGVLDAAVALTHVTGDMPRWLDRREMPAPRDIVAFENGLLDVDAYCRGELGLIPPTPRWFSGAVCPYPFDPDAQCAMWERFLQDVFNEDQESIDLAQEWMGLLLVPDVTHERLMIAMGRTRSGKGAYLRGNEAMLGDQWAVTSFAKIASRFGLHPLLGKLAAFLTDAEVGRSTDATAALEVIKSIVGGDPQSVDVKHSPELPAVRLTARFTIACNRFPDLPDAAGALKPRLLLLHFPNSYEGREDHMLKARIAADAPGIAVWALRGLRRLRANRSFTMPRRSEPIIREFDKAVSPVRAFVDEECDLINDPSVWCSKGDLYPLWKRWADDHGNPVGTKSSFGQSLVSAFPTVSTGKRGPRGVQFPVYVGIRPCR